MRYAFKFYEWTVEQRERAKKLLKAINDRKLWRALTIHTEL